MAEVEQGTVLEPTGVEAPSVSVEPSPASPTKEDLDTILGRYSPEEVARSQHVNARAQSIAASLRKQEQQEQAKRQQEYQQSVGFLQQHEALPWEHQQAYLRNPQYVAQYGRALEKAQAAQGGSMSLAEQLRMAFKGLQEQLTANERFAHLKDEDFTESTEKPVDFFYRIVDSTVQKERKKMDAEIKSEIAAAIKAELARLNLKAEEPSRIPGEAMSSSGKISAAEIEAMSSAEYRRREAEIDAAAHEGRIVP